MKFNVFDRVLRKKFFFKKEVMGISPGRPTLAQCWNDDANLVKFPFMHQLNISRHQYENNTIIKMYFVPHYQNIHSHN